MNLKASAGKNGPKGGARNVFDWCETLELRADRKSEAVWMAEIVRLFTPGGKGGELTIAVKGRKPVVVEVGDAPVEITGEEA